MMHTSPICDTSILYKEARPSTYKYIDIHGKKYSRIQYSYFAASIAAVQPQDVSGDARFLSQVPTIFYISARVSTPIINIHSFK